MISLKDAIYELNHNIEFKNARMVTEGEVAIYLEELQRYTDLEEQGRLIELPCAVGDTVYIPNEKFPAEIEEIRITPQGTFVEYVQYDKGYEETEVWDEGSFCMEDIGETVFLTPEEAEAKLAEMKGEL